MRRREETDEGGVRFVAPLPGARRAEMRDGTAILRLQGPIFRRASLMTDLSGATALGGRVPVNPSGGLLAKGHPLGATGVAQLVELCEQLQGRAGKRQVEGARIGLSQVTGGGIWGVDHAACSIHILSI